MEELFGNQDIFSYPKPTEVSKILSKLSTDKDSIILDFFSGSATTAHAVMQLNAEDGGNNRTCPSAACSIGAFNSPCL